MSELVIKLTDDKFQEEIESSKVPMMVDFWASWCAPCKMMTPLIDEAAAAYKGKLKIAKINVEEDQATASQLGVMNIPAFIFFKDGKEVLRFTGVVSKRELAKRIEKVIGA